MANSTAGKFWLLDSEGVVVDAPVYVKNVAITWKTASAGTLEMACMNKDDGTKETFLYAASTGATSAATNELTQIVPIDNWINGLEVLTIADVAKCIVNVK